MANEMGNVDTAVKASHKTVISREKEIGEEAERPSGPVGLDIGTSHIVMAQNKGKNIHTVKQLNAFFTIPYSKFTKKILVENEVNFFEKNDQFYILGYSAENFANMFNTNTRRTMEKGLLSAREDEGITVLQAIINTLINKPKNEGEVICFSIPGQPIDSPNSTIYHESVIKMFLSSLGFRPISINEGLATVMSELAEDNFTGIGISMGGGMCNVCLSYLSVPVITYSIQKGGDYIDYMVGASVGEPATKIKTIKEGGVSLNRSPKNRVETALHIYYDDLINSLLHSLQDVLHSSDKIPKIAKPIPIALAGGTVLAGGFREHFEKALSEVNLPVEISEVRIAEDTLNTTAKGAMVMALSEEI
ncbi:hypothetical protein [Desulfurivibrio alkaliphilus]|uniref:Uncharacterized protein n=1 Tax=Desulfurivibrio alkaliphilus (strain DSM 19089 / UNIQEM U267 / AHT2) TaxID=589865 RepID=D6Z1K7_DESAT|nr:hypothetical protein [Desulfurivibrio alkaliphilus]ADH85432.1 conserved hypothetical protein [Desulfurivibrio alkaliphilus AHT 2]